jgi:hypothetical protein
MRPRFCFVIAVTILISMCPFVSQGQDEKPQLLFGGFDTTGTVSVGYRFTTVKGEVGEYNNLFDLHDGFRLMDVNLTGRAPAGTNLFADSYSVTASGLGGDPYSATQVTVRKDKLYDLAVNYRQSYYYWGRNDNAVLPIGPSGISAGLTSYHNWATIRRLGSMNLNVRATNRLRFTFEYSRESRDGMTQTTRTLDYPGSSSTWGSFSRANPYLMAAPLNELSNRFTGGISYMFRDWTFHYRLGYQAFSQDTSWNNLVSPEQSIDTSPAAVNAVTVNEKLTNASWSESRRLTSPVSEFSYSGKANSWLEMRGGYTFYRYTGPDTVNASYIGNARTNSGGTTIAPYALSLNSRAHVTEPTHMIEQGLTAKIRDWWNFYADYHYTRSTTDGLQNFASVFNGAITPSITVDCASPYQQGTCNNWVIGTHLVDLNMEFVPTSSLVIRTGIRYMKRDVETSVDGTIDPIKTDQTKSVWPTISVFYKPVKIFSVRGDFQSNTSSDPYTPVSAGTDVGSRFVFRLQPTEKISVEDTLFVRNRTFLETSFHNRYRSNALSVSYNFSDRFSANAGYTYESLFGTGEVIFIRGPAPLNVNWQDAFINRGLTGGLILKPVKRFGINVSGNFLRTTGASQITGEPPTIGPLTFPLITGTLYYDFQKVGRLSIILQRTYYIEQLVTGNNFQANLLTIKWTKNINPPGQ